MGLLANFKIRTKVLIALLPLAIMVIVASVVLVDRDEAQSTPRYSSLIDKDVKALQNLTIARALNNPIRSDTFIRRLPRPTADRMRVIDADLDQTAAQFRIDRRGGETRESGSGSGDQGGCGPVRPGGCRFAPESERQP